MRGEINLQKLLQNLRPVLGDEEYVFCTLTPGRVADLGFSPMCVFREAEGTTVICAKTEAEEEGLGFEFPCKRITLTIHSSLQAVGLIAAVSAKLAAAGISANVVAAYYHDHVFVPTNRAPEAMQLLQDLSRFSAG